MGGAEGHTGQTTYPQLEEWPLCEGLVHAVFEIRIREYVYWAHFEPFQPNRGCCVVPTTSIPQKTPVTVVRFRDEAAPCPRYIDTFHNTDAVVATLKVAGVSAETAAAVLTILAARTAAGMRCGIRMYVRYTCPCTALAQ